jgi:hypothetical protein
LKKESGLFYGFDFLLADGAKAKVPLTNRECVWPIQYGFKLTVRTVQIQARKKSKTMYSKQVKTFIKI